MNQMLGAARRTRSRRQRDFVADASHELQSPLTTLRAQLEVVAGRRRQRLAGRTARRCWQDTVEMDRLVHDLLYLARTTDGVAAATA